jgi:flagellar biosynthesis protein FliR
VNIEAFTTGAQLLLLIFVRIFAMLTIAPVISSQSFPALVRSALSLLTAVIIFPWVSEAGYLIPDSALQYGMILIGEILIGVIMGFMMTVVFAVFLVAGQFFSFQMGFGASQVFDPLAMVEIPLMGQFLNLVAMLVFLINDGLRKLFLVGVLRSFESIRAVDLLERQAQFGFMAARSMVDLFRQSIIISFPILGTLLLVSVALGLLAKAAPQMNLMMLGFPLKIGIAFFMMFAVMPFLMEAFARMIDAGFVEIARFITGTITTPGAL